MASTLMSLLVKLGLDTTDYDKGIDKAEGKATGLGGALAKIGKSAVIGGIAAAGAGVAALGGFLVSTIKPASDLGESINAVNVVFGEGANALLKYGETAAQTVGLSNREFNQMATTTGAFLQNVGFNAAEAGDETIKLTERAADMASVFNTDVSTALAAIQSGLKGEFNPLEQFGVKLNAAAIESRALEMGLAATAKELTDSQKATAALELIYDQTAKTAGDFANTSDSVANSQKIVGARFEDIKAKVGTALLPLMQKLSASLLGLFDNPAFQDGLNKFIQGISDLAGWLITNLPVAISTVSAYWNNVLVPAMQTAFEWIKINVFPVLQDLYTALATVIPPAIDILAAAWNGILLPILQAVWSYISTVLIPVWQSWANWLAVNIPLAVTTLVNIWNTILLPALMAAWTWIQTNLIPLFQALGNLLSAVVGLAVTVLAGLWQNVLQPALTAVGDYISTTLGPVFQTISDALSTVFGPATEIATGIVDGLHGALDGVASAVQVVIGWINDLVSAINNLDLPDWLTPGSPTPFEMGLRGISDAMSSLTRTQLPAFSAELDLVPPAGISAALEGSAGAGAGNTYNIFSRENPGYVENGLRLSELMGGAA